MSELLRRTHSRVDGPMALFAIAEKLAERATDWSAFERKIRGLVARSCWAWAPPEDVVAVCRYELWPSVKETRSGR